MPSDSQVIESAHLGGTGLLSTTYPDLDSDQREPSVAVILITTVGLSDMWGSEDEIHTPRLWEGRKVVNLIP